MFKSIRKNYSLASRGLRGKDGLVVSIIYKTILVLYIDLALYGFYVLKLFIDLKG